MQVDTETREALKRERGKRGMSVAHVSRATGINPRTIHNLEKGVRTPHYHTLARLRKFYRMDEDEEQTQPEVFSAQKAMRLDILETRMRLLINELGLDAMTETPDYILADYLRRGIELHIDTAQHRKEWHGH